MRWCDGAVRRCGAVGAVQWCGGVVRDLPSRFVSFLVFFDYRCVVVIVVWLLCACKDDIMLLCASKDDNISGYNGCRHSSTDTHIRLSDSEGITYLASPLFNSFPGLIENTIDSKQQILSLRQSQYLNPLHTTTIKKNSR